MMGEWSDGAPRRSECWKSGVGSLGEYLRGKRTPFAARSLCHCVFLTFSRVVLGMVAKASDLNSNFGLCTGTPSLSSITVWLQERYKGVPKLATYWYKRSRLGYYLSSCMWVAHHGALPCHFRHSSYDDALPPCRGEFVPDQGKRILVHSNLVCQLCTIRDPVTISETGKT